MAKRKKMKVVSEKMKDPNKIVVLDLVPSFNFISIVRKASEAVMLEAHAGNVQENDKTYNFVLSVEELITNVLRHGLKDTNKYSKIIIKYIFNNKKVTAIVYDKGPKYIPPKKYDLQYAMEHGCGMGLHFVRTLMDEYKYIRDDENSRNIVVISKKI
ncbi:ATP-binding protein [Spirochaetota bacterium]